MLKIFIGQPRDKEYYFFEELLISIYSCLQKKGVTFELVRYVDQINYNCDDLYLGIFNSVKINNMPKKYIMYNLETIGVLNDEYYKKMNNAQAVINIYNYEYNEFNYQRSFNKNMIYIPLTYSESLKNIYNINLLNKNQQDIDVLFYGSLNKKRTNILNKLKHEGINITTPQDIYNSNVFGKIKDELIERSKIILLINYYEKDYDMIRPVYLLSKKKCIISENSGYSYILKKMFNNTFPVENVENLSKSIKYLLNNLNKREEIENNGYNFVKLNLNIENFIDPLIDLIKPLTI